MRILLVGNYVPDAQESMRRYADLMRDGLSAAGHVVTLAVPREVLNQSGRAPAGIWKWIGYVDKYIMSPSELSRAAQGVDIVHICDHSNAVYVPARPRIPYVVTCHDLLAVRGAMGEDTDCPASFAGRQLQKKILNGLGRAAALACVSGATLRDAQRLLAGYPGRLAIVPNALNHGYRRLEVDAIRSRLSSVGGGLEVQNYVLHVGSNLRRKNREGVLRAVAGCGPRWNGKIVFAGQPLTPELWELARQLELAERVIEVVKPANELLEGLYNGALALVFPSRFEGFGWPIIEAHACGCPVICSNRDPFPDVTGDAAIMCDPDDYSALGDAIATVAQGLDTRKDLSVRGLNNARRFSVPEMIARLTSLYQQFSVAA